MTTPDTLITDMSSDEIEDLNQALADEFEDELVQYRVQVSGSIARLCLSGTWMKLPDSWTVSRLWTFTRTGE